MSAHLGFDFFSRDFYFAARAEGHNIMITSPRDFALQKLPIAQHEQPRLWRQVGQFLRAKLAGQRRCQEQSKRNGKTKSGHTARRVGKAPPWVKTGL